MTPQLNTPVDVPDFRPLAVTDKIFWLLATTFSIAFPNTEHAKRLMNWARLMGSEHDARWEDGEFWDEVAAIENLYIEPQDTLAGLMAQVVLLVQQDLTESNGDHFRASNVAASLMRLAARPSTLEMH